MPDETDTPGLSAMQQSMVDAAEILMSFISTARGGEQPTAAMIEAAETSIKELLAWCDAIDGADESDDTRH
tara:strand:- start:16588 stop:16800 length:213 start_codon:yes stop_codon:yes gene_type:complete